MACSCPQEKGVPVSRWSNAEIAQRLLALGVAVHIAGSTIGRWLALRDLNR